MRRFACGSCRGVWRQDAGRLAAKRSKLTWSAVDWGIRALGVELGSVAGVATVLGISCTRLMTPIVERAERTLLKDPHRLEGVEVIGVEEHLWRHTPKGSRYVTVIGLDSRATGHWPCPVAGHGRGQVQKSPPGLARTEG